MENLVRISPYDLKVTLERLSKLGVSQEHFKRLRSSQEYAKTVAAAFLRDKYIGMNRDSNSQEYAKKVAEVFVGDDYVKMCYDNARAILGRDFIAPDEISIVRKLTYGNEVLQHFAKTFPFEKVLQWIRDNGFVLMAGTPTPMSLLEIRNLNVQLFFTKSSGWYAEDKNKFSQNDKVTAEWLILRKGIVPNSSGKAWGKQQKLLSEVEYVPNVAEMTWGETTYKEVRNAWLFPNIYARTSSVVSDNCRVYAGNSAEGGVYVSGRKSDDRDGCLGLASARKRSL